MGNIFIIKFLCILIFIIRINGEFWDSSFDLTRASKRRLADRDTSSVLTEGGAEDEARNRSPARSEQLKADREERRSRLAARRAAREKTRRQRLERRQQEQQSSRRRLIMNAEVDITQTNSSLAPEMVIQMVPGDEMVSLQNTTERIDIQWMKANLSSLWRTVRELQSNQLRILQASRQQQLLNINGTSWAEGSSESPQCPTELTGSGCENDQSSCAAGDQSAPCSGHGHCCCGRCICPPHYYGQFCECSDLACPWVEGKLCGGEGVCKCGQCTCRGGYTGPACECPQDISGCRSEDGLICSNHGDCKCGRCHCYNSYMGSQCEDSQYSAGLCEQLKPCVLCSALGRSLPQCRMCDQVTVQLSQDLEPSQSLCRMVHSGCLLQYSYEAAEGGHYLVSAPTRMIEDFNDC